jgi:hypothetical protein
MATFKITLRCREDDNEIRFRILRAALKVLLRRFGLRAIKIEEIGDNDGITPRSGTAVGLGEGKQAAKYKYRTNENAAASQCSQ